MKIKGSITIYISIIMMTVIFFVCILSESARIQSVRTRSEAFTYMAADSIMAGYAKQIYKDYGILLVWERQSVEEQLKSYIQANINMADLGDKGTNFMSTNLVNVEIDKKGYVTNDGGDDFVKQIISYTKYSETLTAIDKLAQDYKALKKSDELQKHKNMDVTYIVGGAGEELKSLRNDIDANIIKLKDTRKLDKKLSVASQRLKKLINNIEKAGNVNINNVNKFLKSYRNMLITIDKKIIDINKTINLIKQYEIKKELFLIKNGYTAGERDDIEENLKILENIKDTVNQIKELTVSTFSNMESKEINKAIDELNKVKSFLRGLQSLKVMKVSEQDKKNNEIFEKAKAFLQSGILSLVTDDVSKISNLSISDSNLPTNLNKYNDNRIILKEIRDRAAISLYADIKFGNYLKSRSEAALSYEMEYIVSGKNCDKDNLKKVVEKLAVIRSVINTTYLISDGKRMQEIQMIATSAATVVGMPFLEPIFKAVVIEAWALAESVNEIRQLLRGECIPLKKTNLSWKTDLFSLDNWSNNVNKQEQGLYYQDYLKILIMLEDSKDCIYRIMDLIEIDIRNKYNNLFRMSECFQSFSVRADFETKQLFTSIPLIVKMLNKNNGNYKYSIRCAKEY